MDQFIRDADYFGGLILYAQLIPEFMAASTKVYKAGFRASCPAPLITIHIADGAKKYNSNRVLGLLHLENIAKELYEKRWPSIQPAVTD